MGVDPRPVDRKLRDAMRVFRAVSSRDGAATRAAEGGEGSQGLTSYVFFSTGT